MVVLLATGLVPAAAAGLLAAGAILLFGILNPEEIYRSINWTTVILVGAMMPLSTAITETGAAKLLAEGLIYLVGGFGPRALLAGLFVLTAVLGQVISNTATALIIIPISVVAATQMGLSPQPVLMCVAVAAAAAFLTPVATPDEPDGDGARRLPLRRLLEVRPADDALVLRHRGRSRAGHLALLATARPRPAWPSGAPRPRRDCARRYGRGSRRRRAGW